MEVEKIKTKAEIVGYLRSFYLQTRLQEGGTLDSFIYRFWLAKDEGNNLGLDQRSMTFSKQRSYFETQLVYLRNGGYVLQVRIILKAILKSIAI